MGDFRARRDTQGLKGTKEDSLSIIFGSHTSFYLYLDSSPQHKHLSNPHIFNWHSSLPQPEALDSPALLLCSPIADIVWRPPEAEDHRLIPLSGLQPSTAELSVDCPRRVRGHKPQPPSQRKKSVHNTHGFPSPPYHYLYHLPETGPQRCIHLDQHRSWA